MKRKGNSEGGGPRIRRASRKDIKEWRRIRKQLWPETSLKDHTTEIGELLGTPGRAVAFLSVSPEGRGIGFIEATLRQYVEGCSTSPVGYIEGWYVVESSRRRGIGTRLVRAAERWAASRGAKEMVSDTETTNRTSQRAHMALGYKPVQRLVFFAKRLR